VSPSRLRGFPSIDTSGEHYDRADIDAITIRQSVALGIREFLRIVPEVAKRTILNAAEAGERASTGSRGKPNDEIRLPKMEKALARNY
jgi:hypothetical protein